MAQRDINNIDKTILDNFYKLVHTQPHVRLTAASSTYKILNALKKKEPTKFNDNLNYCIDRLVAGLASSRALARQGYGTLLLELLKSYQVSTERLFSVANDKFGQISRETSRDNLIGYFLLVSIVLKSENHTKSKANSKYVEKMYKIVMQLLNKKSYMECPISRLLMDYYQLFCDYMIADIPPEMILSSDKKPTPAEILMMVVTQDRLSILSLARILKFSQSLNHETNNEFAKHFVNMLDQALFGDKTAQPTVQISAIRQITNIVRRPQMVEDDETIAKITKTYLIHFIFESASRKFHGTVKSAFKGTYHNVLDHLISVCGVSQRIKHLMSLIESFDTIFQSQNSSYLGPAATKDLWPDYMAHLKQHKQVISNHSEAKQLYPITSLYLFYGLQIIEHGLECKSQLDELTQSSEEALKGDPNDGSWADVLTDQILAILSATECSPWIRKLCCSVFGSLLPHISPTSIDLICDALKSAEDLGEDDDEEGSETQGEVSPDDEQMEEDGDVDEDNQTIDESDKDDDTSDESESDSESETDAVLEDISGDSAMSVDGDQSEGDTKKEEQDDDEEEYLDDEQMMKLDSVIADMFRLNRLDKKNKKKLGDQSFKLRCLDLVKKIVEKKPNDTETIETLLETIIPLALKSRRSPETRPITEKVTNMLAKMKGKTKYPKIISLLGKK